MDVVTSPPIEIDSALIDHVHDTATNWFDRCARPLPWREASTSPWGILVCEVMSQQTPVARVIPIWEQWMARWPIPSALAAAKTSDVIVAWDRLGYPRRALRLQECARTISETYAGVVPETEEELLALPGVGAYTAAAVMAFAFGKRSVVLDTNIRRVEARVFGGVAFPAPSASASEYKLADSLVPPDAQSSVHWNQSIMEIGALICTARSPQCSSCPLEDSCQWTLSGRPEHTGGMKKPQSWAGSDRQVRGIIMARLRSNPDAPLPNDELPDLCADKEQVTRCARSLVEDGLLALARDNNGREVLTLP